jgi:hypothetical protein
MVLTACKSNHFGLVNAEFTSFRAGSRVTPAYFLIIIIVVLACGNWKSMKLRERQEETDVTFKSPNELFVILLRNLDLNSPLSETQIRLTF